jgi:hypothetical protein
LILRAANLFAVPAIFQWGRRAGFFLIKRKFIFIVGGFRAALDRWLVYGRFFSDAGGVGFAGCGSKVPFAMEAGVVLGCSWGEDNRRREEREGRREGINCRNTNLATD